MFAVAGRLAWELASSAVAAAKLAAAELLVAEIAVAKIAVAELVGAADARFAAKLAQLPVVVTPVLACKQCSAVCLNDLITFTWNSPLAGTANNHTDFSVYSTQTLVSKHGEVALFGVLATNGVGCLRCFASPYAGACPIASASCWYTRVHCGPRTRARVSNNVYIMAAYCSAARGAPTGDQKAKYSDTPSPFHPTSHTHVYWGTPRTVCGAEELVTWYVASAVGASK